MNAEEEVRRRESDEDRRREDRRHVRAQEEAVLQRSRDALLIGRACVERDRRHFRKRYQSQRFTDSINSAGLIRS